MSTDIKLNRVFIASPGGLAEERRAFKEVITHYNEMDAMERGVVFTPIGWEITLGGVGRPQALINEEIKKCDYFLLLLWDRWGSRPDLPGKGRFSSGTEEEYHVALECLNNDGFSMRQIVVFFKAVDPSRINDPGPQLNAVLDFKRKLEDSKELFFHTFDDVHSFEQWLQRYLASWVRDHEDGRGGKPAASPSSPMIGPASSFGSLDLPKLDEKAGPPFSPNADLLRNAEVLADAGKLMDAEAEFARAIMVGNDPDAINRYGHFLKRLGRLDQARFMYERVLSLAEAADDEVWQATAFGNLGLIYQTRGELDRAEEMHKKSLAIEEKLGRQEGMASQYGNLGLIYEMRGELDRAEEMHKKSLAIEEKLGRQEGMASDYGNLGLIYRTQGELDRAEEMLKKSLAIEEKLGRQEGMASQYGNLGLIYQTRGELDRAEEMYKKVLAIDEKLGRQESIANAYGNLGLIYQTRGELDRAEEMHKKSLAISEKLGRLEGMASTYGNLGLIYQKRGELDRAEEMHKKSLAIEEKLGRLEGMASDYGNLGSVAKDRGDLDAARELWTKARDLDAKIGMPHRVKEVQGWLDELPAK